MTSFSTAKQKLTVHLNSCLLANASQYLLREIYVYIYVCILKNHSNTNRFNFIAPYQNTKLSLHLYFSLFFGTHLEYGHPANF